MGCCGAVDNNIDDLPYGKIEEFNNLKSEIEEIITGKNNKDRKNANKLFDLFDRTSNKITEYEKEIKLIKNKKKKNNNINDNMIHELNNDIKQLKEYNHTLNDLLKESNENEILNNSHNNENQLFENLIKSDTENDFPNDKIIKEEINISNKNENDNDNDKDNLRNINNINNNNLEAYLENDFKNGFQNGFKQDFQNESENDFQNDLNLNNNNENNEKNELNGNKNININININTNINNINDKQNEEKIYFKKSIRRNNKSDIFNKKIKLIPKVDYNIIENYQENELMGNNKNHVVNDENNLINIIFALENGEKIDIQIEKDKKFMDAMEKLGEQKEEYNDIEKLEILDGNDEIIDKVKNGEIISSFGFDNNHIIQIKIKD